MPCHTEQWRVGSRLSNGVEYQLLICPAQGVQWPWIKIEQCLLEDRRWTLTELQERTGVQAATVRRILHKDLQMRKICAKWVAHHLTQLQKWTHNETCRINLERFQQEGQAMLNRIIAVDETWARAY